MKLQDILNKWKIKCDIYTLFSMWNETQRHYHTLSHLNDLIRQIKEHISEFTQEEYEKLIITALFHDCIYDPSKNDNEEKSADFFMNCCVDKNKDIQEINQMILDTKTHKSNTKLSEIFNKFDMNIVERKFSELLEWEKGIAKEYSFYSKEEYKEGRIKFLESLLDKYVNNTKNLLKLIDYVRNN